MSFQQISVIFQNSGNFDSVMSQQFGFNMAAI